MMLANQGLTSLFSKIVNDGHSSAFIPICLYSRNLLRVSQVETLVQTLEQFGIRVTFVIADYLHGLNLILRGYRSETSQRKAKVAGENLQKMVRKVLARKKGGVVSVYRWAEIAMESEFHALLADVETSF